MYEEFLALIILILPAYFANSTPVIFGGGTPVDFNKKFIDKKRIFGDGKTWRGLFAGLFFGSLAGWLEGQLCYSAVMESYFHPLISLTPSGSICSNFAFLGFLMASGTMFGDLFGSFIKRRLGMPSGHPSIILDQLTFLFFALLFIFPFMPNNFFTLNGVVFLIVLTYILHVSTNFIANKLGLKKVPW
jgi:CDP-2,3-bis-(O-geranylgeranyl)-sn-glycerol synthase